MSKATIYVDTREQKPYKFRGCIVEHRTLKTGDYSVKSGLGKNGIVLERKSLNDLFSTLTNTSNRKRFEDELSRMNDYGFKAIVIEGGVADVLHGHKRSAANGRLVLKYLLELCLKHKVTPLFCGCRIHAELVVFDLLTKYHENDPARRWW